FAVGGWPLAVGRWLRIRSLRFWSRAQVAKWDLRDAWDLWEQQLRSANCKLQPPNGQPPTPKKQGRSGCSSRAACVSRLATLFAGHPRTGSLCSMGPPHRVDWRLSRPVLIIFAGEVSEKCARIHEFYFSLDSPVADDLRPTTDQGCSRR